MWRWKILAVLIHCTILVKLHTSFPKNVFREVFYAMIISVDLLNEEVNVEY